MFTTESYIAFNAIVVIVILLSIIFRKLPVFSTIFFMLKWILILMVAGFIMDRSKDELKKWWDK